MSQATGGRDASPDSVRMDGVRLTSIEALRRLRDVVGGTASFAAQQGSNSIAAEIVVLPAEAR